MDTPIETLGGGIPRELDRKFTQARRHIRAMSAVKGFALAVFTVLAAFAIVVPLDYALRLGIPARILVFAATVGALIACLVIKLALPLLRRYTARQIALSVEDRHPHLGDTVVSTVELTESRAAGKLDTSTQLVDALASETLERTRRVDFRSVAPFAAVRWALLLAAAFVIIVGAYCAIDLPVVRSGLMRLLYPTANIAPYTHTSLAVEPGSCTVRRGDSLDVLAIASRRIPERATIVWRTDEHGRKRARIGGDDGRYRYTFKSILRPVRYYVAAGDAKSHAYTITPVDPPAIVDMDVTYAYPDYTGREDELAASSGDVRVLRGTQVTVAATASKAVTRAWVTFEAVESADEDKAAEDSGPPPSETRQIEVSGRDIGPFEFLVDAPRTYRIYLRDEHGFENAPVTHLITPEPDTPPEIDIVSPKAAIERTLEAEVPVRFAARDDHGLTKLRIVYHAASGVPVEEKDRVAAEEIDGEIPLELDPPGTTEFAAVYWLTLASLKLEDGMKLDFYIEATDNDTIDGPKTGRSARRTINIVSDESSVDLIEREQRELLNRLIKLINRQIENRKLTEQLERELAAEGGLDSERENELERAKQEQSEIGKSTRQLSNDFDPTTQRMEQNPLIHPSSIMRMEDMKSALEDLARGKMPQATSQLQAARNAQQPDDRSQFLEGAERTEQEIVTDLERVRDQFERLMDEQKLLALANALGGAAKEQDRNIQGTKDARGGLMGKLPSQLNDEDKRRLKRLSDKQEQIRKKVEDLERRLEQALTDLERNRSDDAKAVEAALQDMQNSGLFDQMKQAQEELQASRLNKSLGPQKKASDELWKLSKRLEQAHKNRLGGEFQNTQEAMEGHISEIDRLIELEEAIIAATETLPTGEDVVDAGDAIAVMIERFGLVEDEQRRTHERAGEFAHKLADIFSQLIIFGVDPVTPMQAAVNSMGDATEQLSQIRRDEALNDEKRARDNLLKARDQLAEALAKMQAAARMQQLMDQINRLAEIIEKQRKINEDTKETDIQRPPTEDLSAAFKRLIQRIGNRQGRLGDEVTELGAMLRQLLEIGTKMQDVSKMLRELRTDKEVQEEQDKILRALEQMMFSLQQQLQQMMAGMGMGMAAGGGGGNWGGTNLQPRMRTLPGGTTAELRLPERLRERLRQAWTEKYPESFRELLSLYYRRLSDEDNPY